MKDRRKNYRQGGSTVLALPASLELGSETTIAANRILIADVRGKIPETVLLEFLEDEVEPRLWPFLAKKKRRGTKRRPEVSR